MRVIKSIVAVALTMLVCDLLWLGVVAESFYSDALGSLRAPEAVVPAAALFYLQYVAVIVLYAVLPSPDIKTAARRGAGVGWLAYATYELTNWAVIAGWPSSLVAVDIIWGVALTTVVAVVGRAAAGDQPEA